MSKLHKELNAVNKMITKMYKQKDEIAWSWEVSCTYVYVLVLIMYACNY